MLRPAFISIPHLHLNSSINHLMEWRIIEERKRDFADESYFLKAERSCPEGTLVLEICWAQIMYAVTVDLLKSDGKIESMYDCMVFYEDRIEKYGHQIMRITEKSPVNKLERLALVQKDGVLNYVLSKRYGVNYKSALPSKEDA